MPTSRMVRGTSSRGECGTSIGSEYLLAGMVARPASRPAPHEHRDFRWYEPSVSRARVRRSGTQGTRERCLAAAWHVAEGPDEERISPRRRRPHTDESCDTVHELQEGVR